MRSVQVFAFMFLLAVVIHFSCKKEYSCENCLPVNQAPVADAGKDTLIRLQNVITILNGSKSFDPDGTITTYQWEKISGPGSYILTTPTLPLTRAEQLQEGVYQFELTVTDNGGLSAKDTVQVSLIDPTVPNNAPVADAGPDKIVNNISEPVILDGSASTDPENNIAEYHWTSISGPAGVALLTPDQPVSGVMLSQAGLYLFELTVTDSAGLFSKDTVQIQVDLTVLCDIDTRRVVNVRLVPVGKLSEGRYDLVAATAGSKILFAGGLKPPEHSGRVDIYDFVQNSWESAELSVKERQGMAAATVGNKILFAGGGDNDNGITTSRVDIYDVVTGQWNIAELSESRNYLAAATVGNKVFFGGGIHGNIAALKPSKVVDIFDNSTDKWTTAELSEPHAYHTANVAGNKIYFAGGIKKTFPNVISNRVDIFDAGTNTWSTTEMKEARMLHAGFVFNNRIFWASGIHEFSNSGNVTTTSVEIKDLTTGITTTNCINPRTQFRAVEKDKKIVFFTGIEFAGRLDRFDIYDTVTGEWYIGQMDRQIVLAGIISVNNKIYIAGGTFGSLDYFDQVWTLDW